MPRHAVVDYLNFKVLRQNSSDKRIRIIQGLNFSSIVYSLYNKSIHIISVNIAVMATVIGWEHVRYSVHTAVRSLTISWQFSWIENQITGMVFE